MTLAWCRSAGRGCLGARGQARARAPRRTTAVAQWSPSVAAPLCEPGSAAQPLAMSAEAAHEAVAATAYCANVCANKPNRRGCTDNPSQLVGTHNGLY